jgi:hypothetical protein
METQRILFLLFSTRTIFAVLYYDIAKCTVTVFDGLNASITFWQDHIIHTIKLYGMQMPLALSMCKYWEKPEHDEYGRRTRNMELEICFEETNTHWLVYNEQAYIQSDGCNCGPIACLKVMEIYGFLKVGSINVIGDSVEGYQPVVLDYFNSCVMKYNTNLMAEQRKKRNKILDKISCKKSTEDKIDDKMAASFLAMVDSPPPVFDSGNVCTEDDIDQKMAASLVAMDNNHPPVFDSNSKNEQLPLDHEQVAEECSDNN